MTDKNTIRLRDFNGPLNAEFGRMLMGTVNQLEVHQATATDANLALAGKNANPVLLESGQIVDAYALIGGDVAATGETMEVDLQKSTDGGATYATVLSATLTLDENTVARQKVSLMGLLTNAGKRVAFGDRLRAALNYTAGGGPTPMTSTVVAVYISPEI